MFCPFCKAEYRAGIVRCSDCSFALVETIPKDDSDPNFMVVLWNGESLPFLEAVCAELDRAELPVAAPRVEVLLRDSADRYHLKSLKTFPYVLGVFKRDFDAARKILESIAKKSSPPVLLPSVAAYPEPFDERPATARGTKSDVSLDATVTVYSFQDLRAVAFLEASLDVVDIPSRRVFLKSGSYEIQVRPKDEATAQQILKEIASGIPTSPELINAEDELLREKPVKSYFLLWFIGLIFYALYFFSFAFPRSVSLFLLVLISVSFVDVLGMVWMMCQAMRYEVRSFRYCVATQLPLAFVWYYVERVMTRTGAQKLPVSARVRMQPPQT